MRILTQLLVAASLVLFAGTAFATVAPEADSAAAAHGMAENPHGDAHDSHAVHGAPPVNWTDMGYGDKDVNGNKLTSDKA